MKHVKIGRDTIVSESRLHNIIKESIKAVLRESEDEETGVYGLPSYIDLLLVDCDNDRECYDIYDDIQQMLVKKARRGVELSPELLANSSVMKRYQQFVFKKFKWDQMQNGKYDRIISPKKFRDYKAQIMIEDVYNIIQNEQNEENIHF